MTSITRKFGGRSRDWPVYERAEAEASDDPDVRGYLDDWRRGLPGQYVLTDDGLVVEVIRRKAVAKSGPNRDPLYVAYKVATAVGETWLKLDRRTGRPAAKTVLEGRPMLDRYRATGNVTDWARDESHKGRAKRAVRLLARFWVGQKGRLDQESWDVVGQAYRPDCEIPRANAKRFFLKTQEGRDMTAQAIAKLFDTNGIHQEDVVAYYDEVRKGAQKSGDFKTALAVVDRYAALLKVKEEDAAAETHMLGYDMSAEYVDDAEVLSEDNLKLLLDE